MNLHQAKVGATRTIYQIKALIMTKQTQQVAPPDMVKEFNNRLRALRAQLAVEVRSDVEESEHQSYSEVVGEVRDSGDESNAELLTYGERMESSRHSEALSDIDAALERLKNGSFGRCVDCSSDIGLERLKAYPTALRCIGCQTRFEKQRLNNVGPSL